MKKWCEYPVLHVQALYVQPRRCALVHQKSEHSSNISACGSGVCIFQQANQHATAPVERQWLHVAASHMDQPGLLVARELRKGSWMRMHTCSYTRVAGTLAVWPVEHPSYVH
jgi:hypothetical protein